MAAPIAAGETVEHEFGNHVPGGAGGDWRVSSAGPAGSVVETRVTVDTIGSAGGPREEGGIVAGA